jgi:periplasmic copper chaperone A
MINLSRRLIVFVAAMGAVWGGPAAAHKYRTGNLEIVHPWSRAMPMGARVGAGYVLIKNNGTEADRLVAVSSEICEKAELHTSVVKDNVATMHALPDGVVIPAQAAAEFEPGGMHIMLVGLKKPLKEGEFFKGTFTFEKAGKIEVRFAVEEGTPGKAKELHRH